MRWSLLALLAVSGPVAGLSVETDAPREVPTDASPFPVLVNVTGARDAVEVKAWLGGEDWQASRTFNGSAFQRSDFYALELAADDRGRADARVWVRDNPESSNADRLSGELVVGARVRAQGERASDLDGVRAAEPTALVVARPNESVQVLDANGSSVFAAGSPTRRAIVGVPLAENRTVCDTSCGTDAGWQVTRLGDQRAHVDHPRGSNESAGGLLLAVDGEACPLDPANVPGRVNLSTVRDRPACREVPGGASLARLTHRGREVEEVPQRPGRGQVVREPGGGFAPWRLPVGIAPEPVEFHETTGRATAFATRTDGLATFQSLVGQARERIVASTYVFTNAQIAEELAQAARRGVDVHLYLEPSPIGGLPDRTPGLVDRIGQAGGQVHWHEGPSKRGIQHAKVLVVDGSVVVVFTENFTEHGLPDDRSGNVGFGLGVANRSLARRVESVFRQPGPSSPLEPADWSRFSAPIAILTSPENAWRTGGVPAWIDRDPGPMLGLALSASPRWGPRANPWLSSLVNASREHPVDLVFSGQPEQAAIENRRTVAHLVSNPRAGDIDARVARPGLGTVHAKALFGGEGVLVGSSNWGMGGSLLNREVNLLVEDAELASRFREIAHRELKPAEGIDAVPGPAGLVAAVVAAGARATWVWSSRARSR